MLLETKEEKKPKKKKKSLSPQPRSRVFILVRLSMSSSQTHIRPGGFVWLLSGGQGDYVQRGILFSHYWPNTSKACSHSLKKIPKLEKHI